MPWPYYEMSVIDLPDGGKAWVCGPVKRAIYPQKYRNVQHLSPEGPEKKLLRRIFGEAGETEMMSDGTDSRQAGKDIAGHARTGRTGVHQTARLIRRTSDAKGAKST